MSFLSPFWLFAASAILIPIAIHLWNKRQGKTVRIGSLRWLEESASSRLSSIKLTQVGLLLLRCVILMLLAAALAEPVWMQIDPKKVSKKAVVVSPELLYTAALQSIKPAIDTLVKQGFALHTYTSEMQEITLEKWQQLRTNPADSSINQPQNYWSLLPLLSEKYNQPQDSVILFTSDQKRFFTGTKPASLPENITWIPVATETETTWLQTAAQLNADSLLLLIGHSSRDNITYSSHRTTLKNRSITSNGKQFNFNLSGDYVQLINGYDTSQVILQKAPFQVAILSEKSQQPEVIYIKAALNAISSYTGLPINITETATADSSANFIFWLRSDALPERIKAGRNVWVQAVAKPTAVKTSVTLNTMPVKIHQVSQVAPAPKESIKWRTAAGEALLTKHENVYYFRSGFAPQWSDLGQSAQLPELLLPVLFPQPEFTKYDVRASAENQFMPTARTPLQASINSDAKQQNLLPWFVLAAFMLFLVERFLAIRRTT